jgi:transcriptional regulator with XRE-family HTH domain
MKYEECRFDPEKLRKLMNKRGFNNLELAQRLGITGAAVGAWFKDNNKPQTAMLEKITGVFGCSMQSLFTRRK